MKPRAALYHRVSTVDQRPELADVELRQAARARGLRVVLHVTEKARAGQNDRAGLRRILDAARRHQVDAVLVWKLDRFGRSLIDLVNNVRQLRDAGVRFICTTQGIDLGAKHDSANDLQFNILAAVAEYEKAVIRERTRLGLAGARRRGVKLGRPSDGPDPAAVAKLRGEGHSWPDVAKQLRKSVMRCRRAAATATTGSAGVMSSSRPAAARARRRPSAARTTR